MTFARLLAQIIRLKAQFPDFTIQTIRLDNSVYPTLGGEHKQLEKEIYWNLSSLSHLDPRTNQCEQEVQRIIYLYNIANQLPDSFTNLRRITKLHIPVANAPDRVDVPARQIVKANDSRPHLKRVRPIGSKDKNPRKRKGINDQDDHGLKEISEDETQVKTHDEISEEVKTS
ncbi:uncharacterized protein [Solanum lycopersicum]|uniref:uncharacterized protein n=1 Tax=Solanum lycopersicum TaxID=4081 RepID=UPI00374876AA